MMSDLSQYFIFYPGGKKITHCYPHSWPIITSNHTFEDIAKVHHHICAFKGFIYNSAHIKKLQTFRIVLLLYI